MFSREIYVFNDNEREKWEYQCLEGGQGERRRNRCGVVFMKEHCSCFIKQH